jgi:hypothetical protein
VSDKMIDFKNAICDEHLVPIENRIREMWPGQEPKITLLIRTPWLPDGGILITNDATAAAVDELNRLREKEAVR